ncbi:restriction endonuclease subunit S [Lachnospiraceae bacterium]|nr:restriction endonuclease subunit S [Lachnospiraceae bacterium]
MEEYTKYKDSGKEWIGVIPEHWERRKLSSIARRITDYVASGSFATLNENVQYLDEPDYAMLIRTVDLSGSSNTLRVYIDKHSYDFLKNSNLFGGEIILSNIGSVGSVFIYKPMYERATLAPNAILVDMKECNRYYYYCFVSPMINNELRRIAASSVQPKLSKTQLRNFYVIRPPLKEQKAIADYLDKKVGEINDVISQQEQQAKMLRQYKRDLIGQCITKGLDKSAPKKDSGVDWIGEVPEHWEVTKIKWIFEIVKRIYGKEDRDVLSITQNGLKIKDITSNEGQLAESYANYQVVNVNDFAMNSMDLLTGWVDCSSYEGVTSPDYRVFRFHESKPQCHAYYKYLMQMCYTNRIFYRLGQGVSNLGRWRLQAGQFLNMKVPQPPVEEQRKIASFLDDKVRQVDNLLANISAQIEKLKEYRKIVIHDAVTGKIKVTEG